MAKRKRKQYEETDLYYLAVQEMNKESAIKEYRKLAKRLNQRILRLEKAGMSMPTGEAKRMMDTKGYVTDGKYRFKERVGFLKDRDLNGIKHEILVMHRFEESKQSTVKGVKETRQKIKDAMMKKTLTPEQVKEFDSLKGKKKDAFRKAHALNEDLYNLAVTHINDLRDKMAWEYEKAVEYIMNAIAEAPEMTESRLKVILEVAVNTRNEEHFKKMINNPSTTSYSTFRKSMSGKLADTVFTYKGKDKAKKKK